MNGRWKLLKTVAEFEDGGYYDSTGYETPASARSGNLVTNGSLDNGFRPSLYIDF